MSVGKIRKFRELNTFPNVFQNLDYHHPALCNHEKKTVDLKGRWNTDYFKNDNPIVLELACGKGDYTVGLAHLEKDKNFIGADLKGNRIWTGAKRALEMGLKNVAFIRTRIEQITEFFDEGEVSEIWITFPDPFPKKSKANKRLTSSFFLDKYQRIAKKEAIIHLKTDDESLFDFSLQTAKERGCQILEQNGNIYKDGKNLSGPLSIQTYYEQMHLENGKTIKYLKFVLG